MTMSLVLIVMGDVSAMAMGPGHLFAVGTMISSVRRLLLPWVLGSRESVKVLSCCNDRV